MTEPIKKGDLCIIIDGYLKEESPNIGKIVTVGKIAIEHPLFGPMVEISGEALIISSGDDIRTSDKVNIPVKWLKKIEPPTTSKTKTVETEKETAL